MKGIVFTEFLEMVEKKFGYETVDNIITKSDLESEGIYTSVGTYDDSEIVKLLTNLSFETKIDSETLLHDFGKYMFNTFLLSYQEFSDVVDNTFDFLSSLSSHIHIEILKLYPEEFVPHLETKTDGNVLTMVYMSKRKMSSVILGLIEQSIEHFGEKISIQKNDIEKDGSKVKFVLIRE